MKWFHWLIDRFDGSAARCEAAAARCENLIRRFEGTADHCESASQRCEALLSRAEVDRFAAHASQMGELTKVLQESAERVHALTVGFEVAEKGVEIRVKRLVTEACAELVKLSMQQVDAAARSQRESERWRLLAMAHVEAQLEKDLPSVTVAAPAKRKKR